ncbi:hypothetical protein EJ02DRAFT_428116 [Clathrospora elynae]|uniref:Uncharacterized protein n=1 Tax=Clathrospora elynae TaxID=706981 RepID=A0A6A5S793_9PLEO|nr:hypothetical protein EJ02DRAFT_428116 [Clathrospora elynae]
MLNSTAPFPSATALARKTQAASNLPLSSVAQTLTRHLFGEILLPPLLQKYSAVMFAFAGSVAVASGLYSFFQKDKNNRTKMQLAFFHVVLLLENMTNFQERIQDPQTLTASIKTEVKRIVHVHLTQAQGEAARRELKRNIWTVVDERRMEHVKRRKDSANTDQVEQALSERTGDRDLRTLYQRPIPEIVVSSPASTADSQDELEGEEEEGEKADISMLDIDHHSPTHAKSSERGDLEQYNSSIQLPLTLSSPIFPTPAQQFSSVQGYSTYKFPSVSYSDGKVSSSPTPLPRPKKLTSRRGFGTSYDYGTPPPRPTNPSPRHGNVASHDDDNTPPPQPKNPTPSSGFGLSYDNHDLSSSSSSFSSTNNSPTEQAHAQQPRPRPTNTIDPAVIRVWDPTKFANRLYQSPVLSRHKAGKRNIVLGPRPTKGTWLYSIRERKYPQASHVPGTTEYRVNETGKFHAEVDTARKERWTLRREEGLLKGMLKPNMGVMLVQQEKVDETFNDTEVEMDLDLDMGEAWSALLLSLSDEGDEDDLEKVHTPKAFPSSTVVPSIQSHPWASEISHPVSSSPNEAHTPEEITPPFIEAEKLPSLPSSEDMLTAPVSQAVRNVSPPPREIQMHARVSASPERIVVGSSPIVLIGSSTPKSATQSPPQNRRGRGRQRRTPSRAQPKTPATDGKPETTVSEVRRSARLSALKKREAA